GHAVRRRRPVPRRHPARRGRTSGLRRRARGRPRVNPDLWMGEALDLARHAEVVAIREAAAAVGEWRLEGCTLVVTLEPCTMCAGAIVAARLDRLVFGAFDPKAGAVGSLWDVVRDRRLNHRPEVSSGVLAEASGTLLRDFFAAHRVEE